MIDVRVVLARGRLSSLSSRGHAIDGGEGSIPCAAVSALLGAVSRTLLEAPGCKVVGSAPEAGNLELRIAKRRPGTGRWLRGITDMLLQGLGDVAREHPGTVRLTVQELQELKRKGE